MILLLKAGAVTCCASAWSAAADEGQRVIVLTHNATIGLKMTMPEFLELVSRTRALPQILDLSDQCETPQETMERLGKVEAGRAAIAAAAVRPE